MTAQGSLFDAAPHARTRVSDPATSLEAARSITPGRTERLILAAFQQSPRASLTDAELAQRLPCCDPRTVATARSRLKNLGLLEDSGTRKPSPAGRPMTAWRLAA